MNFHNDEKDMDDIQSRLYKLIPKQTQDIIATIIFLVVLPIGFLIHIFFCLTTWYPSFGEAWMIRVIPLLILGINVYLNWYFMLKVGPNGPNPILPNVVKPGFKFCHSCRMNAPPRAYHCPVCDECSFRRDHHCSFGGICVGHFNQRYFIAAVVNLWLIVLPLITYSWDLMWLRIEGGFSLSKLWQIMLPHLALFARFINFYQFCHVLFCAFTLATFLFITYLVVAQFFCLWKGQTRVEYLLDVHAYQLGLMENIRQSLGSRWYLTFLLPFIPSPLPSNGLSYATREISEYSAAKDM